MSLQPLLAGRRSRSFRHAALGVGAAGAALFADSADAAVIYSGIQNIPFSGSASQSQNIDLDGDTTNDMQVLWGDFGTFILNVNGQNGTTINGFVADKALYATRFDVGQTINSGGTSGGALFGNDDPNRQWVFPTPNEGFVGMDLNISGQSHLGWMHFVFNTANSGTLVDWAYESSVATSIQAGFTPVPEPTSVMLIAGVGLAVAGRQFFARRQPAPVETA